MPSRTPHVTTALLRLAGLLCLAVPATAQPNVLLVIADDLGVDKVGAYGAHPDPARTPVIDRLASEGVLFRNVWVNPFCSPSRAALLTGRYGFRTGIGTFIAYNDTVEVSVQEPTIPKLLPPAYRTAAVGKWHISGGKASGPRHPLLLGFDHHRGSISNFRPYESYFDYTKLVDGEPVHSTTYATTETVDDALELIADFGSDPWFVWLAFNAPHTPYHHPPEHLHGYDLPDEVTLSPIFMKALTEAMDTELGRLLDGIAPDVLAETVVIVIGDNGTRGVAIEPPHDPQHGKSTVFEGGVHVPLIVTGPGVAQGATCDALVNGTDVFGTVLELAGVTRWPSEDSVSCVPYLSDPDRPSLRPWIFAERFLPNGTPFSRKAHRAIRDDRYKLRQVLLEDGAVHEQLYDLLDDPHETRNLLAVGPTAEQRMRHAALSGALAQLRPPPFGAGVGGVGGARPGSEGHPELHGAGRLEPYSPYAIGLLGARPHASAALVGGTGGRLAPFRGGTLAPRSELLLWLPSLGPGGGFAYRDTWEPGVPSGLRFALRVWIDDPLGPAGYAASNGLLLVSP